MKLNLQVKDEHCKELMFLHTWEDLFHILHRDQHKTNFWVVLCNELVLNNTNGMILYNENMKSNHHASEKVLVCMKNIENDAAILFLIFFLI